jgi:hypothetical protein
VVTSCYVTWPRSLELRAPLGDTASSWCVTQLHSHDITRCYTGQQCYIKLTNDSAMSVPVDLTRDRSMMHHIGTYARGLGCTLENSLATNGLTINMNNDIWLHRQVDTMPAHTGTTSRYSVQTPTSWQPGNLLEMTQQAICLVLGSLSHSVTAATRHSGRLGYSPTCLIPGLMRVSNCAAWHLHGAPAVQRFIFQDVNI